MTTTLTGQDKAALVLDSLEPQAVQTIMARLGPERSNTLRSHMQRLAQAPPPPETREAVLNEFAELLVRGLKDAPPKLRIAAGTDAEGTAAEARTKSPAGAKPALSIVGPDAEQEPPADPLEALRQLGGLELTKALEGEQPRTTAIVLSFVDTQVAGDVLKRLAAETRREVSVQMGQGAGGSRELVVRIAEALMRKKRRQGDSSCALSSDDKARKMADMLRLLDRPERLDILAALDQRDPTTAAQVKDCLYTFEDLSVMADRSVQKVMAEIDAKSLAVALKNADQDIVDKVMNNLSKRARESLTDEIGFLGPVAQAQIQQARKIIVDVIQRLDVAGELIMEQQQ